MGVTTQRKICGALLTLAASAFGVDRWVIGSDPAEAQAGQSYAIQPAASAAGPVARGEKEAKPAPAAPVERAVPPARGLSARLRAAREAERLDPAAVADAFRPSKLWFPAPEPPPAPVVPAPAVPAPPKVDLAAEFKAQHRLTAVMKGGGGRSVRGGMAMVDGKTVLPGQAVGGFVLVAVREHSAVFHKAGHAEVELVIPGHDR